MATTNNTQNRGRNRNAAPSQKAIVGVVAGLNVPANRQNGFLAIGMQLGSERVVLGIRDDFEFINDQNQHIPYMGLIRQDDENRGMGITGLFAYSRNHGENDWTWLEGYTANDAIFVDPQDAANATVDGQLVNLLSQIFGEDWDGTRLDDDHAVHLRAIGTRPGRFGAEFAYAVV